MWGLTKKIGLVVLFYLNGIACGIVVIWLMGLGTANQKSGPIDHPSGLPSESRPIESFSSLLARGDRAVRIGQLEQAERCYRAACDAEPNEDVVQYKLGLTYEYSAQPDAAKQIYRRLAEQTEIGFLDRLARLGLARIQATKGQFEYANELLWHLLVNPSHDDSVSEEAAHLLAINLGHSPFKNESQSVHKAFMNPVLPNQLISHLDFLAQRSTGPGDLPENNSPPQRTDNLTLDVLTKNEDDLANCTLMINAIQVPANQILILLSDQIGFEVGVSEAAKVVIESSVREIHASKISFTMLLHSVLAPIDLGWRFNDGQLEILGLNELEETEQTAFRNEQTIHLFRYALFMYPDLELAGYTRFAYANYLLRGKDELTAIRIYQDLLRLKHLNRQVRHLASYNMGVAYEEIGQPDRARRSFSWIADDSPHGDVTATALISISRIDLAELKFKSSARVCARAASAADSKQMKADGVIRLALSYALNQNYFSANNSLAFYKAVLDSPDDHDLATFLSAHSRFRAEASDRRAALSAELVRSVANVSGKFAKHPELAIIVSQAYDDLGFQMLAMNEMANYLITQPESQLQLHALQEFVRFVAKAPKPTAEIKTLTKRVESMFPKTNLIAISRMLHQAKQLFKNGDFENCKKICMQILQMDQARVLESQVLSLLGYVYEKEGKHHTAALCFAGVRIDLADQEGN